MSTQRILEAIDNWINHVIHDESIGYAEAVEVVIAKMHNEAAQRKRQRLDYSRRRFLVTTEYEVTHGATTEHKSLTGTPHAEVLPYGDVKLGCITFTRASIAKLAYETQEEPHIIHGGYMPKDPGK